MKPALPHFMWSALCPGADSVQQQCDQIAQHMTAVSSDNKGLRTHSLQTCASLSVRAPQQSEQSLPQRVSRLCCSGHAHLPPASVSEAGCTQPHICFCLLSSSYSRMRSCNGDQMALRPSLSSSRPSYCCDPLIQFIMLWCLQP